MLYESMRQLLMAAESPDAEEKFQSLDLTFTVQLTPEEGGNVIDLMKGGKNVMVTASNIQEYVRLYAEYKMLTNTKKALKVKTFLLCKMFKPCGTTNYVCNYIVCYLRVYVKVF